jgi:hypothetical protein
MNKKIVIIVISLVVISGSLISSTSLAQQGRQLEVTITNITRAQVMSPPVVISHNKDFQLFELGSPAIDELVMLAEDGMADPLVGYVGSQPSVLDSTTAPGPLMPGESVTLSINTSGRFKYITAVGMLVTTNDAFFAIEGIPIHSSKEKTVYANAYDAGSEANAESCAHIPGPPCGNTEVRNTDGAEGYVHVHAGIHGIADLVPADHDWRNPVAEITMSK